MSKLEYIGGLIAREKPGEDGKTVSSSKFWFNIANGAITIVYLMLGYSLMNMQNPPVGDFAWLTLVYSGVVATNKFANKFLDYKYGGGKAEEEPKEK